MDYRLTKQKRRLAISCFKSARDSVSPPDATPSRPFLSRPSPGGPAASPGAILAVSNY